MSNDAIHDALASGRFAFLDLGSGSGGSLDHCIRRFALGPGLGLEYEDGLVEEARRAGFDSFQADVTKCSVPEGSVQFVTMMDFLEHLPDEATALDVLERFSGAARDFLYIRHPSFEDIDYLASVGVKLCWTDWTGHPNMMRLADFARAFERLGWHDYIMLPRLPIADSSHHQVVALAGPRDVEKYDEVLHGPKPFVTFDRPVYSQFDIFVRLNADMDETVWQGAISSDLGPDVSAWQAIVPPHDVPEPLVLVPPGLYTSADSRWYLRGSSANGARWVPIQYGAAGRGLVPVVGDFDGDGRDGLGLYDPTTGDFFLRNVAADGLADVSLRFGPPGGIPIVGDWSGTGVDTIGVYMPDSGHWFLRRENTDGPADVHFSFGPSESKLHPIVGDWDGDGVDSVGLYDPATGYWYLRNSATDGDADLMFTFGPPDARPIVGDWNGDGINSIGIYLPEQGEWHLRNVNSNGPPDVTFSYRVPDATPVAGRWAFP